MPVRISQNLSSGEGGGGKGVEDFRGGHIVVRGNGGENIRRQ